MIGFCRLLLDNWALRRRVRRLEAQVVALRADNEDLWEVINDRWADQTEIVRSVKELWAIVQPGSVSDADEVSS